MLKRIITSVLLVAILVPALIFFDTPITPVLWGIIALFSMYETSECIKNKSQLSGGATLLFCVLAAACPFLQYYIGWSSEHADTAIWTPSLLTAAFAAVFILYALGVFGALKPNRSPVSEMCLMLVYVSAASMTAVAITQRPHGGFILPMVFIASWATDSFAYLCGSFFGKHKLIPSVSPKKTVEGSVGGTVMAVAIFALYGFIVSAATELTADYIAICCTGACLSIISQIGDLNASFIKRTYGIKDFGKLFPGHGGMLDRFDSVIAVTPLLFVFSMIFSYFS